MNMIEVAYKWSGTLTKRTKTEKIVLHHAAASSCTVEDIHRWHLANGWSGIGYHYFVRKDGNIYRGRPEDTVGAHAYGANSNSIGICFEGNFETETMPEDQKIAGSQLVADLLKRYGLTKSCVIKHKDVNATACPGKNFPFDEIVSGTYADTPEPVKAKNAVLEWQRAAVADGYAFPKYGADGFWGSECETVAKRAVCKKGIPYRNKNLVRIIQAAVGFTGKDVDGKFGAKTEKTVKAFQKDHGLTTDGIVGLNTWKAILMV